MKKMIKKLLCLLFFHKWEKHIAWDNIYICSRCLKMKSRSFCCNAKIKVDRKAEIRFCSKCKKRLD